MQLYVIFLILISVSLSAVAQLFLKLGAEQEKVTQAISSGISLKVLEVFLSPYILAGAATYFLGFMVWVRVLSTADLSMAYPFVGLSFVLTAVLGHFVLGEAMTVLKVLGIALIVIGCVLVARPA